MTHTSCIGTNNSTPIPVVILEEVLTCTRAEEVPGYAGVRRYLLVQGLRRYLLARGLK